MCYGAFGNTPHPRAPASTPPAPGAEQGAVLLPRQVRSPAVATAPADAGGSEPCPGLYRVAWGMPIIWVGPFAACSGCTRRWGVQTLQRQPEITCSSRASPRLSHPTLPAAASPHALITCCSLASAQFCRVRPCTTSRAANPCLTRFRPSTPLHAHPQGATYLYERFYKPTLLRYQPKIDAVLSKGQKALVRTVCPLVWIGHAGHLIIAGSP